MKNSKRTKKTIIAISDGIDLSFFIMTKSNTVHIGKICQCEVEEEVFCILRKLGFKIMKIQQNENKKGEK